MISGRWLAFGVVGLALIVLPFSNLFRESDLHLFIALFHIAGLAVSWNILAGFVGRVNLGHVAFFGLGAMVTRELWLVHGWEVLPAFLVGGVVAAIAALIIGAPALRLKGIYFSVGTLALAEALRLTVNTNLPRISGLRGPMLREYELSSRYLLALVVVLLIVAVSMWLYRSKIGLGMMAIREDEEAARSIGINVFSHSLFAFVLSAFLAGLVGGTFGYYHLSYYHSLTFSPEWTFDALLVTFIGGIGTLTGPLIGAIFFVVLRDILASNPNLANVHLILFGVIFVLVVLVLPGGFVELIDRTRQRFGADTPKRPEKPKQTYSDIQEELP